MVTLWIPQQYPCRCGIPRLAGGGGAVDERSTTRQNSHMICFPYQTRYLHIYLQLYGYQIPKKKETVINCDFEIGIRWLFWYVEIRWLGIISWWLGVAWTGGVLWAIFYSLYLCNTNGSVFFFSWGWKLFIYHNGNCYLGNGGVFIYIYIYVFIYFSLLIVLFNIFRYICFKLLLHP